MLLAVAIAGCGGEPEGLDGARLVRSDLSRDRSPAVTEGEVRTVGRRNRQFGYELYARVADAEDGNVALSPWSLISALSMSLAGAEGTTAEEMRTVLGHPEDPHPVMNATQLALDALDGDGVRARTVNGLWCAPGTPLRPEFLDVLAVHYGSGVFVLDQLEGSEPVVNEWYARETDGEIQGVVPEGTFDRQTAVVLTNAVFLEAPWAKPFPRSRTYPGDFHLLDGSSVTADMMSRRDSFEIAGGEGWIAAKLRFSDERLSMVLLLPDAGRFEEIEAAVPAGALDEAWWSAELSEDILVVLPRFDVDLAANLSSPLRDMGLVHAQDPDLADFSAMLDGVPTFVSAILQQARVRIDEDGVVASAGTAVVSDVISLPDRIDFDRPFLFGIFDDVTGQLLFVGRVVDPS